MISGLIFEIQNTYLICRELKLFTITYTITYFMYTLQFKNI